MLPSHHAFGRRAIHTLSPRAHSFFSVHLFLARRVNQALHLVVSSLQHSEEELGRGPSPRGRYLLSRPVTRAFLSPPGLGFCDVQPRFAEVWHCRYP